MQWKGSLANDAVAAADDDGDGDDGTKPGETDEEKVGENSHI